MKHMKWMKNIVLSLILGLTVCAMPVEAAESVASLPDVEVILENAEKDNAEEFVIKLQASDVSNPMPAGAKDGLYTMTIKGADKKALPQITFEDLGKYEYKIWQEAGKNEKCTYDKGVYRMIISVTNNETYDGHNVVVALYKDGVAEKQEDVVFKNVYEVEPPETEPETKKPENVATGDQMNISLYLAIMGISVIVMIVMYVKTRKEQE